MDTDDLKAKEMLMRNLAEDFQRLFTFKLPTQKFQYPKVITSQPTKQRFSTSSSSTRRSCEFEEQLLQLSRLEKQTIVQEHRNALSESNIKRRILDKPTQQQPGTRRRPTSEPATIKTAKRKQQEKPSSFGSFCPPSSNHSNRKISSQSTSASIPKTIKTPKVRHKQTVNKQSYSSTSNKKLRRCPLPSSADDLVLSRLEREILVQKKMAHATSRHYTHHTRNTNETFTGYHHTDQQKSKTHHNWLFSGEALSPETSNNKGTFIRTNNFISSETFLLLTLPKNTTSSRHSKKFNYTPQSKKQCVELGSNNKKLENSTRDELYNKVRFEDIIKYNDDLQLQEETSEKSSLCHMVPPLEVPLERSLSTEKPKYYMRFVTGAKCPT